MYQKYKSEIRFLSYYMAKLNEPSRWIGIFKIVLLILFASLLFFFQSCKKSVEISEPTSLITTSKVFSNDAQATAAMEGVYFYMVNGNTPPNLFSGGMTLYAGLSSDELLLYDLSNTRALQFNENNITSLNTDLSSLLWNAPFYNLYSTNAVLEGLERSISISDSVKNELTAEAKFVRAFMNFYLINLYGDIPYVTETNWRKNSSLSRNTTLEIYDKILSDLNDAQSGLPNDYSVGKGQRIIPNKWAAIAMLARVHLFLGNWVKAEEYATLIINSSLFSLVPVLNDVFKVNSPEAIWQLQQDKTNYTFTATVEGATIIPRFSPIIPFPPFGYIRDTLFNSFEANDNRKTSWLSSKIISGKSYYYPYKYKVGVSQAIANGPYSEYYMVLRLAEQYLIRAEAKANGAGNGLSGAITDVSKIRTRAGLSIYNGPVNKDSILKAIQHERQIELFAEWGHRWLDLKRWDKADAILSALKGTNWQPTDKLYPIPQSELATDPNLTQNPGY
jgi:starch-binding outer membrane protein, SusD/RagB family